MIDYQLKGSITPYWNFKGHETPLEGIRSPNEYTFEAYKIKSVLSVRAQIVFNFFACLVQEKIYMKSLFAFLKTLTNSVILNIVPEAAS